MNKAQVIGNLGSDPEVRYTPKGTPVATFSVATTERWKDQEGQQKEHTEWHRIVVWRRLAEICGEFLKKGSKVYIEGKMQTRKWQDKDGKDRHTTEIIAVTWRCSAADNETILRLRTPIRSRVLEKKEKTYPFKD